MSKTHVKNPGICILCQETFEHRLMTRHFDRCLAKHISQNLKGNPETLFLIKLSSLLHFGYMLQSKHLHHYSN